MTPDNTRELIAEARRWANGHPNRRSGELMRDLADALAALATPQEDGWCREESCQHRYWRSGSMPTHRRGTDCPELSGNPEQLPTPQEGDAREVPHIPYPGDPYNPAHIHDWADNACQSGHCMARPDGTTQPVSRAAAPEPEPAHEMFPGTTEALDALTIRKDMP